MSEDDISEDEVAGEEEGASGASCHTEAGMFTCDDRHDDTPTPTPTPVIASDTHTPTPTTTSSPGSGGGTTPDVPTGLTSAAEPGRISLDWNTVGNATGYEVYQWSGYESTEEWYRLPFYERPSSSRFGISFNGSSAVVSGVTEGVCYSHILRSKNGSRYSGWSSTISTCVPHSDPPPSTQTPTPSHYHTSCQRHSTNGFFIWHVHSVPGSSYLSDPCTPHRPDANADQYPCNDATRHANTHDDQYPCNDATRHANTHADQYPCNDATRHANTHADQYPCNAAARYNYDTTMPTPPDTPVSELQIHAKITHIDGMSTKGSVNEETTSDLREYKRYWSVLESLQILIEINGPDGVDVDDYEFRITAPPTTGVYIGGVCDYDSSLPSNDSAAFRSSSTSFFLVRCDRGDGISEITIESRHKATGANVDNSLERLVVTQARRHHDKTVSYRFCDSLPPPSMPPDPELDYDDAFSLGAGEWNSASTGMSIERILSGSCTQPDRVAVSFVNGYPCGAEEALGCVRVPLITDLDLKILRMQIDVDIPNGQLWTSKGSMRRDDVVLYLPATISHEFGHAAGLGHSGLKKDLMYKEYDTDVIAPSTNDVEAMRRVYR